MHLLQVIPINLHYSSLLPISFFSSEPLERSVARHGTCQNISNQKYMERKNEKQKVFPADLHFVSPDGLLFWRKGLLRLIIFNIIIIFAYHNKKIGNKQATIVGWMTSDNDIQIGQKNTFHLT